MTTREATGEVAIRAGMEHTGRSLAAGQAEGRMAAAPWPGEPGRDAHEAQPPWPAPIPGTVPPIVRSGAVPPIVRGGAAGPPSSGHFPAVAPASPPPPRPTGGFPAVGSPPPPRGTGAFPAAMRPSGAMPVPHRPTGGPRATGTFGPPSGGFAAAGAPPAAPHPSTGSLRAVSALPTEGDDLDGFKILSLLGRGSMGRVYRARDAMGRNVAMKVILAEQADPEGIKRFTREGQAMAAIPRHKNVVNVHTTGEVRGLPYLVLDYVDGKSLDDLLKRGRMRVLDAVAMGVKLALAVQHVHQAGVLHRDLKPANILIRREDGEPVVTDFGMAGVREGERITRTGDLLGTPLYMPPEQVLGMIRLIDARSDVWALGAILYETLAGSPPFIGQSLVEVSRAITSNEPPPIDGIDASLMGVLRRAMAKRKEDRFQTAGDLAEALVAWGDGVGPAPPPPPPAAKRRALAWALGAAAVGMTGLAAVALWVAANRPRPAATPASPSNDVADTRSAVDASGPSYGPFAELVKQVQAGQLLAGVGLANQLRDERGSQIARNAAEAEAAVRRELAAVVVANPPRIEDLGAGLTIVRRLRDLAGLAPAADLLADSTLGLFRQRMDQLGRVAAGKQAPGEQTFDPAPDVTLLETLCDSGLLPTDRSSGDRALDAALLCWTFALKLTSAQYQQVLVVMARFDVDLQRDHLVHVDVVPQSVASLAACIDFLNLRIRSENNYHDTPRKTYALQLMELVESPRGSSLGPVARARGLWQGVLGVNDTETALKLLDRASELDPRSPWPAYHKTNFHLEGKRYAEAARWANESITRLQRDDYDQRPSVILYETFLIYRVCIRAFIRSGDLDRARDLLARLDTFADIKYDKLDELKEELAQALAEPPVAPQTPSEF